MTVKRSLAGAVAAVGAVVLIGGLAAALVRDGGGPASGGAPRLTAEGHELVALLDKGLAATYHARYLVGGAQMTMDVWRKDDRTRQEVAVQAQQAKTRSATFVLPPQTVRCDQVGDRPWTCKPPSPLETRESPEEAIRGELTRGAIAARNDTIAGLPVRCFTFPDGGQIGETCLLAGGVVARMTTPTSRFDLFAYSQTVVDEVFVLPAA